MSFILDALRKSESQRQQDAAPRLVSAPLAMVRREVPRWVWALFGLSAICLVAMAVALWGERPDPNAQAANSGQNLNPASESLPQAAPVQLPAAGADSFGTTASSDPVDGQTGPELQTRPPRRISALDTIDSSLAGLTLNMIAFDESDVANRFAFISGRRYFTGERIGGTAEIVEIRVDSIILAAVGERFQLEP